MRELEDQIDLESKKKTVKNLEKIKQDLEQIRSEKAAMSQKSKPGILLLQKKQNWEFSLASFQIRAKCL